jgi:hypothetical protein
MGRGDPGLREAADHQQLPQMPRVSPVSLRSLLAAFQAASLRRLRQVDVRADPLEFLDHEPPAGRCLQRNLEIGALKPRQEPTDPGTVSRRDPRARHLTGDRVDPLRRDLRAMLIHPHHQRHQNTTPSTAEASSTRRRAARRAGHRIP